MKGSYCKGRGQVYTTHHLTAENGLSSSQLYIPSPCSFPFNLLLLLKSTSWFTSEEPCLYSCLPLTPIHATRLHSEFTRPFFNSQMTAKPWKQFFLKQIYVVYSFLRQEVQIPLSSLDLLSLKRWVEVVVFLFQPTRNNVVTPGRVLKRLCEEVSRARTLVWV